MSGRSLEDLERDSFLAEAETLAQLVTHPAWPRFDGLLTEMRLAAMEEMAQAALSEIPYWQGVVATLREIKERPHQIVAAGRDVMDEESQKREERGSLDFVGQTRTAEDDL